VLVEAPARITLAANLRWSDASARLTRWLTVLRAQRPTLFITVPLLIGAAPLLLVMSPWAPVPVAVALCSRVVLAVALQSSPVEALLSEFLLVNAWLKALLSRKIVWRGRELRVAPGGRMREAS
jgi:ceramide glucosyltransferase